MCGILGILSKHSLKIIDLHIDSLSHRGPDSQNVWESEFIQLGHTRLSIIDLSENANQPFHSNDGRHVIVYNGEIYNFLTLSQKLEIQGNQISASQKSNERYGSGKFLRTKSDTEVLLNSYLKWNTDCLEILDGMFAFAVYDKKEEKLFIARDALGIKPLFYFLDEDIFAFSSELKALTAISEIKKKLTLNKRSISSFLHLGYIPSPDTIYNEIKKFPPGHFANVGRHLNFNIEKWWSPEDEIDNTTIDDESIALEQLEGLLESSVRARLISDVPIGSFLSGGVDSSLVALMANRNSTMPFKTFTIGFEDNKFDESRYASKVAKAIGTDHTEHILKERDAMELILEIVPTYDEPFADSSAIPTMLVSRLARRKVKVVLTGDGGDELFHGYGSYKWSERFDSKMNQFLFRKTYGLLRRVGNSRIKRISELLQVKDQNLRTHIFSQEQYFFRKDEIDLFTNNPVPFDSYSDPIVKRVLSPSEKQALFDLTNYLPDDLLVKIDRASMKYGLEARVPLLDRKLTSFAINLNPGLKRNQKFLLKEVLFRHLPKKLFDRPKWGFGVPLEKWLRGEMSWMITKYLNKEIVEELGCVKYDYVKSYIEAFVHGDNYLYNRIWSLIILHWWFENHSND